VKPRLPLPAVLHHETYQKELLPYIHEYDGIYQSYVSERSEGKDTKTWSETISRAYTQKNNPSVTEAIRKQGYKLQ
jgi:FMN reductase [NAD(P)H]